MSPEQCRQREGVYSCAATYPGSDLLVCEQLIALLSFSTFLYLTAAAAAATAVGLKIQCLCYTIGSIMGGKCIQVGVRAVIKQLKAQHNI